MKSATVTWITYNNYGTELQAFALQQFIKRLGIDNTIISDEFILKESRPQLFNTVEKKRDCNELLLTSKSQSRIKRFIKKYLFKPKACVSLCIEIFNAYKLLFKQKKKRRIQRPYFESQEKFNLFKREKLNILYEVTIDNIDSLNNKFDVFVCGSDQIWSPLECNFNGYYYLNFVNKKKFSYATSLGTTNVEDEKKELIKKWTKDYYKVSVRENGSAIQLSSVLNKDVEWVLDPTLLFDKDFWLANCEYYPTKKKYIVCYFLEKKEWYLEYTKMLSRYMNIDFYLIPSSKEYAESKYSFKRGIGPQEFVNIISKADFVLTDSYHASIFSIIFEKDFLYFKRFNDDDPKSQNIRINSLFNLLDINKVVVGEKAFSSQDVVSLDYCRINKVLDKQREISKKYLEGCLL